MELNEQEMISKEGMSNCCSALIYSDLGICSDCKEPCEDVSEEEEIGTFSKEQLALIAKSEKRCKESGCNDDGHRCD